MLAVGCRLTEMSDMGMRVSEALDTRLEGRDGKAARLLLAQGNAAPEQPEFHRVATYGGTGELDFRALDKTQRHQALHLRISRVDRRDDAFLSAFQGRE